MDINNIKYTNELFRHKIILKKQLAMLDDEIKIQQEKCEHIVVDYSFTHCILCNKKNPEVEDEDIIKFNNRKPKLLNRRIYERIKKIAFEYIENDPEITKEQLIVKIKSKYYK